LKSDVRKIAAALIAIEHVGIVGEIGDVKINTVVVIVVSDGEAHACLFAPVLV
jgi:hypothetical protein